MEDKSGAGGLIGPDREEIRLAEFIRRARTALLAPIPTDDTLTEEILKLTLEFSGAESAALLWEDEEEPWHHLARLESDFRREKLSIGDERLTVPPELEKETFLVRDTAVPAVEVFSRGTVQRFTVEAIPYLSLLEDTPKSFYHAAIEGEFFRGRLLLFGIKAGTAMMFARCELAATVTAGRMNRSANFRFVQAEAIREERMRVARDLHDGLLQSFTGVVLHLESLHETIATAPDKARQLITDVQAILMNDQRELRSYVERLNPRERSIESAFDADERFTELEKRFSQQWNVEVRVDRARLDPFVLQFLGWETYRLVVEAVTNAAKHADARSIKVSLYTVEDRLVILVVDDGKGFPWRGRLPYEELVEKHMGPGTLGDRVSSLNGHLWVDSTDQGSTIEITIPMGWKRE